MYPNRSVNMFTQKFGLAGKQLGSSLIIAVFIIVVMSLLAASLSRNISSSSAQVNNEVLGTRALFAAESGNEKALAQIFPTATGAVSSCVASQQMYLTTIGFGQCTVISTCATQISGGVSYYYISSTGACKAGMSGNNSSPNSTDALCLSSDKVCVSRTVDVEAKAF